MSDSTVRNERESVESMSRHDWWMLTEYKILRRLGMPPASALWEARKLADKVTGE